MNSSEVVEGIEPCLRESSVVVGANVTSQPIARTSPSDRKKLTPVQAVEYKMPALRGIRGSVETGSRERSQRFAIPAGKLSGK